MFLNDLPPIVLDDIFSYLHFRDLGMLCRTSRAIHSIAIRSLYSRKWPTYGWYGLEKCLARNPENAKYLREYHVTDIPRLTQFLQKCPLRLERLKFYFDRRPCSNKRKQVFEKDIENLVSSMHPDASIDELDCSEMNVTLISARFLEAMNAFRNLTKAIFACWEYRNYKYIDKLRAQDIVDVIKCDNLKCITFVYANVDTSEWGLNLGELLPKVKGIRFHYLLPSKKLPKFAKSEVENVKELKRRQIFFQVTNDSISEQWIPFYSAAIRSEKEELDAFLEWLIYGERFFQIELAARDMFWLDLRALKSVDRDKTLKVFQNLHFRDCFGVRLSLYADDSNTLYFPHLSKTKPILSDLLHARLRYLHMSLKRSVHTNFIPSLIRSLKQLSRLVVSVSTRKPTPQDGLYDNGAGERNHCCKISLVPGAFCTRTSYNICIDCCELGDSICFNLELKVNQRPRWTIYGFDNAEQIWVQRFHTNHLQETDTCNVEFQGELERWLRLNSGLSLIDFRIFTGKRTDFRED